LWDFMRLSLISGCVLVGRTVPKRPVLINRQI
jgi:hypothetical protein